MLRACFGSKIGFALASVVLTSIALGCPGRSVTGRSQHQESGAGLWLLRIAGGRFVDHVQLVSIAPSNDDATAPLHLSAIPTRDWSGTVTNDLLVTSSDLLNVDGSFTWVVTLVGGDTVVLQYRLAADTAVGL